jgi:hypothetical protein
LTNTKIACKIFVYELKHKKIEAWYVERWSFQKFDPRDIALFAYQFGLVRRDDPTGAPSVIPLEDEVLPLNKVLSAGDPTSLPVLVIVPVSQICPVRQQCHSDVVVQFSEGNDEDLDEDGEPDELMGDKRGTLTEDQIDALFSKIRAHAVSK